MLVVDAAPFVHLAKIKCIRFLYIEMSPSQRRSLILFLTFLTITSRSLGNEIQFLSSSLCKGTLYPSLCISTLARTPNLASTSLLQIISNSINGTIREVQSSSAYCSGILLTGSSSCSSIQIMALNDCLELFQQTVPLLLTSIADLSSNTDALKYADDIRTLLSASIANQGTCLDGFIVDASGKNSSFQPILSSQIKKISSLISNSLAMVGKIKNQSLVSSLKEPFKGYGKVDSERLPSWLTRRDRRLLQASVSVIQPNLIVAKDGSGNFTTISEALAAAPNNTKTRFVIYIKAGGYFENVEVASQKTNLMFIGDGKGETVVKARRNVVDGWTTYRSATVGKSVSFLQIFFRWIDR